MPLLADCRRLPVGHPKAIQLRVARAALSSSVLRVLAPGTRPDLIDAFGRIPSAELAEIPTADRFRHWFEGHLGIGALVGLRASWSLDRPPRGGPPDRLAESTWRPRSVSWPTADGAAHGSPP